MHKDGEQFAKQINGRDGKNWHLPLAPLTATSQPECYSPGDNLPTDRALAAFRLVNNHAAVAKFAARGAGEEGPVPVWAPLSDPSAIPNENVAPYVEKSLSVVAQALMEGTETDSVQSSLAAVQVCFIDSAVTAFPLGSVLILARASVCNTGVSYCTLLSQPVHRLCTSFFLEGRDLDSMADK